MALSLTSSEFQHRQLIPGKYTCQGDNVSPPLQIGGVPNNTKSLVLIVDDPDAATDPDGFGDTFDHWVLFNIAPKTNQIDEASTPKGAINGQNSAKSSQYTGPCPPNGTHRYFFKLYAIDTILEKDSSSTKADVDKAMHGHIIEHCELIGLYQKT